MKGSGARSSVRTTEVPADDRRLDMTKILGSGAKSNETSTVEMDAVSSRMVVGLLVVLSMRRRGVTDEIEGIDSELDELLMEGDGDSDLIEHSADESRE